MGVKARLIRDTDRSYTLNIQGAAKNSPLRFFVVFSATVWDFNVKI